MKSRKTEKSKLTQRHLAGMPNYRPHVLDTHVPFGDSIGGRFPLECAKAKERLQ